MGEGLLEGEASLFEPLLLPQKVLLKDRNAAGDGALTERRIEPERERFAGSELMDSPYQGSAVECQALVFPPGPGQTMCDVATGPAGENGLHLLVDRSQRFDIPALPCVVHAQHNLLPERAFFLATGEIRVESSRQLAIPRSQLGGDLFGQASSLVKVQAAEDLFLSGAFVGPFPIGIPV